MADRLGSVISNIDDTIRQIRSSIYELGLVGDDRGVRARILALVRVLSPVVGFEVHVSFDGPVDSAIPDTVVEHLLATVREAVTNIGRHAHASQASVSLNVVNGVCCLQVVDNGRGINESGSTQAGLGLVNLQRRAEKLHGQLVIESPGAGGTLLIWQVPVTQ
jgi:signal transduction histidine kinase